ncbi:MAG: response regulator, partial [Candidatus Methanoperedens sp.]|nr:response regulator [Candidatus Methanoperedens sp.]
MKVLIVDDEKNNRVLLSKILETHGFEVAEAANGKEALDSVAESPPDFIISDILMPVMDGFQLCRQLKENNISKDIPLIFYTASYTEKEDEKLAMDLGALAFIRKPEEPLQFIERINKILTEYDTGKLIPVKPVLADEKEYLSTYSKRLLNKLEDKIIEL